VIERSTVHVPIKCFCYPIRICLHTMIIYTQRMMWVIMWNFCAIQNLPDVHCFIKIVRTNNFNFRNSFVVIRCLKTLKHSINHLFANSTLPRRITSNTNFNRSPYDMTFNFGKLRAYINNARPIFASHIRGVIPDSSSVI